MGLCCDYGRFGSACWRGRYFDAPLALTGPTSETLRNAKAAHDGSRFVGYALAMDIARDPRCVALDHRVRSGDYDLRRLLDA